MTTYNSPFSGDVIQPTDVSYVSYTISADLTLNWPVNGNTGDVAARIMEISATTTGLKVYMPPANQVSVGQDALIRNTGANAYTVVDATGNTIISVAAGKAEYIYVTVNDTPAGTWGLINFGVGTSNPDAATLAGSGLLAISNTLNQSHPVSGLTADYTLMESDRALTKVWVGGAGTINLPSSVSVGSNYFFLLKNNGSGTLSVACSGAETLDNLSAKDFQPNESAFIVSTGTGYITVGYGTSNTFFFTALTKAVTSGTYTLTINEAQSIIQEYVGTLSGNVTVVYPPVVALYVIANQVTDNGYSLTVTTGISGSASAIVPAGQQASLICDGINFFNANTVQSGASAVQLTDGSAASPSLAFAFEPTTGLYRPGSGAIGYSVLGTQIVAITATGLEVYGTGTFTGGISGGTFV